MEEKTPGEIFRSAKLKKEAERLGILILDYKAFSGRLCCNEFGSVNFGEGWASWTEERERLRARAE